MKSKRSLLTLLSVFALIGAALWLRWPFSGSERSAPPSALRPTVPVESSPPGPVAQDSGAASAQEASPAGETVAQADSREEDKGFGAWLFEKPVPPDWAKIDAFREWTGRWNAADAAGRESMKEEGIRLAAERRPEFKALIVTDPRRALEEAVSRVVRQDLPAEIIASLEQPVSATGDYNVYKGRPQGDLQVPVENLTLRYFETAGGASYKARVYGGMEPVMSRKQVPLRGVAVDRELAVAESPLRQLETGERIAAGTVVEETCPVSGETTEAVASGQPVTESTPTVEVGERVITLCNGSHVTVLDEKYRTFVQASGPGGAGFMMDSFPGSSSRAIGNFRCLYIRVTYPDQLYPPNTEDQANGDMANVARYYLESSYGKMTTTSTVTPLLLLPHTRRWYEDKDSEVNGLGLLHSDSRVEARRAGYDPGQYDCIIVRVDGGPRLNGVSWGGGDSVWISWNGMDVLNHECGHSLGRNHANYWETNDGTAYGNGSNQEYGNSFDVMGGGGGFGAHYNTISKRALGWLPTEYVHEPTLNGVYRIYAYDQPRLEEGKRYALVVQKDSARQYYIEYHPAMGGQLTRSALVLYNGMGSNAGHLLDTTPGSPGGKGDGGIAIGRTYSDPEADIHLTVLAKNSTVPASLDVVFQRGPFPGNAAPTVSLAASATSISPGQSVTFTATASDPNGDPLAYSWDFDDGETADNAAVVTRSFANTAQVTAMLTVSDMKGGATRRHVVINVGTHGLQTVTGTVTAGGQPLANVRIASGSKYGFTDASGSYALSGIATGSQSLAATLNGYAFTPSFTNPLTVVAGTNTANWTATSSTFVTLTKAADATEGGANGSFTLSRTGSTTAALTVSVTPPGGTAALTADYTLTPAPASENWYRTFTIPAGQASLAISVAAVNDTAQEGPETISLQLVSNSGYLSPSGNAATMTLNDNDTTLPRVAVTAPDPYALETGGDTGSFTFTRTGPTTAALVLSVTWTGTAGNGSDYTTLPATVTIPAGQPSATVTVSPITDTASEAPETVIATLAGAATYVLNPGSTSTRVIISDNNAPVITVSAPDPSAAEAGLDSGVFLIQRSGSTAAALKVYYGLSGSALHGTDYAALKGEVTIPAGAASAPVVILPYDDDLGEGTETVTLAVTTFNNAYSVGVPFQAAVSIVDNADAPVVSVRQSSSGWEGNRDAAVTFRAIGSGTGMVTVNYTVSGTATAGTDYTTLSGTVSVPANGASDVVVPIPVVNDATVEATETIVVKITPGAGYRIYNDGIATTSIYDNDSGERVMASTYNSNASEAGAGTGQFYISRTGTAGDLSVNYTLSGTATAGTDYTGLTGTVVIPDGQRGVPVVFTPVDDALAEGTETVTLTLVAGSGYGTDLPASATLEITDNDTPAVTVGFQLASQATSEQPGANGEYRDITVALSAASADTVTVKYAGGGGSASGDDVDWAFVDAAAGNAILPGGTLTFAPGVTTRQIRIRVKNDGVQEAPETAVLELYAASRAALGVSRQSILIFDDIVPNLVTEERWAGQTVYNNQTWSGSTPSYSGVLASFTPPPDVADNYSRRLTGQIVAPATGAYRFWVAADDYARLYLSTDATAANKAQIAAVNGWTDFQAWDSNPSQASAVINLTAGQSYYMEVQQSEGGGGDHVSVAWEGPGFSRKPIESTAPDNFPRYVRLATAASTRSESDGSEPLLMVMLDRPAGSTAITVAYTVSGTATAGSDYTLAPGTLTFAPGEQVKLLPLVLLSDAIGEAPEAIVVSLGSPAGAQLAAPSTFTLTLLDNQAPVVDTGFFVARSSMSTGTVLGTAAATPAAGRTLAGWSIVAGNASNLFAIDAAGQVTLVTPGSLPNPGSAQLVVRATDNAGAAGDGLVNLVINPPAQGLTEERWTGTSAFDTNSWTATPAYSSLLETATTAQNVADNYSRRVSGYLKPAVTGNYTFWIACDDDGRLFLSTDSSPLNKSQIASVSGYTNFQAWDSQTSQKSVTISLVAGQVYYLEAQQKEGGGGDHLSIAWQGPSISRQVIPGTALAPYPAGSGLGGQNVVEERWTGGDSFDNDSWFGTPVYTGTLTGYTTAQNVGDNYSRRLRGYLKPTTTGDYTFWIACDDDGRLFLSTDGSALHKSQIASVSGYTGYQAWDSQTSQKSVTIPLVAGRVYYLEAQHKEGGGGDHLSVAWQGPSISRQAIPATALFPNVAGTDFDNPPSIPSIAIVSPVAGSSYTTGANVTIEAAVAGGSLAVTSVKFYRGATLIGSDSAPPFTATWSGATAGTHILTAQAVYSGGAVTSRGVSITVAGPSGSAPAVLVLTTSAIDAAAGTGSFSWTSIPGKEYRITASSDLVSWSTIVAQDIPSTGTLTTRAFTFTPGTKGFFRVEEE